MENFDYDRDFAQCLLRSVPMPESCEITEPQRQALHSLGVSDAAHLEVARDLVARGAGWTEVLDWVRKYGPTVLEAFKRVLDLLGPTKDDVFPHRDGPTAV